MLSKRERHFLESLRVAHLGTADGDGAPHVVPVCFGLSSRSVYIAIDEKPKRGDGRELKRLRNIRANPAAALVGDRYDEDWRRLGWVMVRGAADILDGGRRHARALALLRQRYRQYREMDLESRPMIVVRIEHTRSWGDLSA